MLCTVEEEEEEGRAPKASYPNMPLFAASLADSIVVALSLSQDTPKNVAAPPSPLLLRTYEPPFSILSRRPLKGSRIMASSPPYVLLHDTPSCAHETATQQPKTSSPKNVLMYYGSLLLCSTYPEFVATVVGLARPNKQAITYPRLSPKKPRSSVRLTSLLCCVCCGGRFLSNFFCPVCARHRRDQQQCVALSPPITVVFSPPNHHQPYILKVSVVASSSSLVITAISPTHHCRRRRVWK